MLCRVQPAQKFTARYAIFGLSDKASLDDGAISPVGFALNELTGKEEKRSALLKEAMG